MLWLPGNLEDSKTKEGFLGFVGRDSCFFNVENDNFRLFQDVKYRENSRMASTPNPTGPPRLSSHKQVETQGIKITGRFQGESYKSWLASWDL